MVTVDTLVRNRCAKTRAARAANRGAVKGRLILSHSRTAREEKT